MNLVVGDRDDSDGNGSSCRVVCRVGYNGTWGEYGSLIATYEYLKNLLL